MCPHYVGFWLEEKSPIRNTLTFGHEVYPSIWPWALRNVRYIAQLAKLFNQGKTFPRSDKQQGVGAYECALLLYVS